jgi:hypothetical protein
VIGGHSVKTTEAGGPRRYDAGKKMPGRKRHAMVDTDGRPLVLHCKCISPLSQDHASAVPLLKASRRRRHSHRHRDRSQTPARLVSPYMRGAGRSSPRFRVRSAWKGCGGGRCFTWLNRNRRPAKHFEATIESATAIRYAASAIILIRRVVRCV